MSQLASQPASAIPAPTREMLDQVARDVLRRRISALNASLSALHAHGYNVVLTERHECHAGRTLVQLDATIFSPGEPLPVSRSEDLDP